MSQNQSTTLKEVYLREIHIENYKGIEEFTMSFPSPLMRTDLDIIVLGSKNGVGKTSVLEACSLLFLLSTSDLELYTHLTNAVFRAFSPDYFVRTGTKHSNVKGVFEYDKQLVTTEFSIDLERGFQYDDSNNKRGIFSNRESVHSLSMKRFSKYDAEKLISSLLGMNSEPVIFPQLLYFHSNRKVQEGSMRLSSLFEVESESSYFGEEIDRKYDTESQFKIEILKALMSRRGLFENVSSKESDETISMLNRIMEDFTGGRIEKLKSNRDNSLELRITPREGGDSFSFDGLSSGQKEIVSTLFMIWRYTKDNQTIVLIDEPELHLNAEWQPKFIKNLQKLAPQNQYIIATHAEEVFSSVDDDRRMLLTNEDGRESG